MLKAALALLLFGASVYIGAVIRKKYKKILLFYTDYKNFLSYAEERIDYSRTPLPEIYSGFYGMCGKELGEFLMDPCEKNLSCLSSAEKNSAICFFSKLGKSNADNTLKLLSEEKIRTEALYTKAQKELKDKGGLYQKLCLIGGIAAVILVI